MSIPLLSFIAAACGGEDGRENRHNGGTTAGGNGVQAGGNVRVALIQPTTAPNPLLVQDEGGAGLLGSTGEFLSFSNAELELEPRIAESWEPNEDGTAWTFKIRQGVTFHNGATLVADDVKTTFDKLINPTAARRTRSPPSAASSRPAEHRGSRRGHRRLQPRRGERELPHARQLGQLQRDHHPGRPRPGRLGQDVRGHGALQAREVHAEGRRHVRPQRRLLGRQGQPGQDGAQVLRRGRPDDPRPPGRRGRLRRALLGLGRQGAPRRPERAR